MLSHLPIGLIKWLVCTLCTDILFISRVVCWHCVIPCHENYSSVVSVFNFPDFEQLKGQCSWKYWPQNWSWRTQIQLEIFYCHLRNRTNPQSHHGNQRKEKKTKEHLLLYIVYSGFNFQIVEFVSVCMLPSCPHALVFLPCLFFLMMVCKSRYDVDWINDCLQPGSKIHQGWWSVCKRLSPTQPGSWWAW